MKRTKQKIPSGCLPAKRRALCFLLLMFLVPAFFQSPQSAASEPQKELEKIQKRLQREKYRVKKTIKKEQSILSELEQINKNLDDKRTELEKYAARLSETRQEIAALENETGLLVEKLDKRKNLLKKRLRSLYKQRQHGDIATILVSAKDTQELIRTIKYITYFANYDSKLMKKFEGEIGELKLKMKQAEDLRNRLEHNKNILEKKTGEMEAERQKKDSLLASVQKKRSSYEQMVRELQESSRKLSEKIKQLEKEDAYVSIAGRKFNRVRGRLPWPVDGEVVVPFGSQKDPDLNIPTFRKGVEIKAAAGNPVHAVYEGRVVYADWFKGYDKLLIISHGSGFHTLYAHLSEIFHKTGDIIKIKEPVGKIGESSVLNVPTLYFEIRYKGKPLNPLEWLRKRK